MYFLRLARLKPAAEEVAADAWEGFNVRLFSTWYLLLGEYNGLIV